MQQVYLAILRVEMSSLAKVVSAASEAEVRQEVARILRDDELFAWADIYRINPDFTVDGLGSVDRYTND